MIKAIIFDFDGVLIESAEIKTKAFETLFADYPDKVQRIVAYHRTNMGISRYIKFRYIFENILKQTLSPDKEAELGKRFSQIVLDQIVKTSFVRGTVGFLSNNIHTYYFFIASGTPEEELQSIIKQRKIDHFFRGIHGTPKQKSDIIADILNRYSFDRKEVVFIGDAESDRLAADKTGINFIVRINSENDPRFQGYQWKVNDLTELYAVIKNIEMNKN